MILKDFALIKEKRRELVPSFNERQLIKNIHEETNKQNVDNISRTKAYLAFYKRHPEIEWALLASMVSRNAGWNMTDLQTHPFQRILSDQLQTILFHTYERPNWLIFADAYPQLLLYEQSKKSQVPMFHLLKWVHASVFMEREWNRFWLSGHRRLLCIGQIINEQNVIEAPVIQHPFYHSTVFDNIWFHLQDMMRMNAVIFPTMTGDLYGFSVFHFSHLSKRIDLGKQLTWLLFASPECKQIKRFALSVEPTGARYDYEQFFDHGPLHDHLPLRNVYSTIHHKRLQPLDWFTGHIKSRWYQSPRIPKYILSSWYNQKKQRIDHWSAHLPFGLS